MTRLFRWHPAPVLAACAIAAVMPAVAVAADEGNAERGGNLAERWCATCHVIDARGTGTAVDMAPPFPSMAGNSTESLRGAITGPHVQMPQLDIGRRDIDDLIAYIRTSGPKR